MEGMKSWFSIIIGLLILALGIVPLLHNLGVISFNFPGSMATIMSVVIVVAGLYLVIDSFMGIAGVHHEHMIGQGLLGLVVGVLVAIMGVFPVLSMFEINVPVLATVFSYTSVAANYFYVVAGLLLIVFGFRFD